MKITKTLININPKTNIGSVFVSIDLDVKPRKRKFVSTNVKIHKDEWNKTKGEVKKTNPFHRPYNDLIETTFKEVLYSINNLKIQEKKISFQFLSSELNKRKNGKKNVSTLIKEFIEFRKDLSPKHILKFENLYTRITDFNNDLFPDSIDQTFVYDFTKYLETDDPKNVNPFLRKSQNPNTIKHTFNFLKSVLLHYSRSGEIENTFSNLKFPKSFKQKMVILTESEIKQLIEYQPLTKKLKQVKDLMLIQIYTGLRFSDLFKINPTQIENGNIYVNTEKTNTLVSIPIIDNLFNVLESHNFTTEKLQMSNYEYNKHIKKLLELVGINKPSQTFIFVDGKKETVTKHKYELIGSHTLRRSFITIGISKGIPIHIIQSIIGHTTIKQLSEYIYIDEEMKKHELVKMNF